MNRLFRINQLQSSASVALLGIGFGLCSIPLGNAAEVATAVIPEQSSPLKPDVKDASDEADQQIGSFKKPAGIVCEVFAAEPDVANPVVLTIDNRGRVFVCESYRQNAGVTDNRKHDETWLLADLAAQTVADRIEYHRELLGDAANDYRLQDDRIKMLVDKDRDGKVDESVTFASGFNHLEEGTGAGILVRGNSAYYTNIPHLWKLDDEDGDGVADSRTSLAYGFGVRVAFRGHDMHGLIIGPDGRLYFSIGDRGYYVQTPNGLLANPESGAVFRCELDGSNLGVVATGMRNPQELAFDNYGNLFTGDNNSDSGDKARWVYVVPGGDSGWRMSYQYLPDRGPFNREKIWYPYDPSVTPAYTVPPIANISDGPSGLTFDPGTGLTDEFRNAFLLCDFRGGPSNSGIRSIRNEADGAFFKIAADAQPFWSILATDADYGPDGSLYVSDWVNGWDGLGKGRVYRFFSPESVKSEICKEVQRILASDFAEYSLTDLTDLLSHVDRRLRNEAQWELANRSATDALLTIVKNADADQMARIHATWGLGQIGRSGGFSSAAMAQLLTNVGDQDFEVAVASINVLSESHDTSIGPTVNAAIGSHNPRIAAAAAIAAGRLQLVDSLDVACLMLADNNGKDPILFHAGVMAMAGQPDMNTIIKLTKHKSVAVRTAAVVSLRKRDDARVLEFAKDDSQAVVLEVVRAVHDHLPLRSHLNALADLAIPQEANPAMARRILNANFRMGGQVAADRLATTATRVDLADEIRLEALAMLSKWGEPGPTDLVMNRYDPIPARSDEPAKQAVEQNVKTLIATAGPIADRTLAIAAQYALPSVEELFRKLVLDDAASVGSRVVALQGLARAEVSSLNEIINTALKSSQTALKVEALKQWVKLQPEKALAPIADAIDSDSIPLQQAAWDLLSKVSNDQASQIMLKGLANYKTHSLDESVRLNVYQAAEASKDERVRDEFAKLKSNRDSLQESNPMAYYLDCKLGGDSEKGYDLFFNRTSLSCVRCHKIGDKGGEVGPNLSMIGQQKPVEYLLESIVAPNAQIADKFKTIVIQTDDGKIYSGIMTEETDDTITLLNADGVSIKVDQDDIIGQKDGLSSMPVDLLKAMNDRELRDIVAFLKTLDGTVTAGNYVEGHAEE